MLHCHELGLRGGVTGLVPAAVCVCNRSAVVPQTQREEERKEEMQDEGEAETTDPFAPAAKSRNY